MLRTNTIESEILSDKLSNSFQTTRPGAKRAHWPGRIGINRQCGDELSAGPRLGSDREQARSDGVRGHARDGERTQEAGVSGDKGAGSLVRCGQEVRWDWLGVELAAWPGQIKGHGGHAAGGGGDPNWRSRRALTEVSQGAGSMYS
jgi:hypothetical protein